jgi:hypothetical protein
VAADLFLDFPPQLGVPGAFLVHELSNLVLAVTIVAALLWGCRIVEALLAMRELVRFKDLFKVIELPGLGPVV